MTMMRDAPKSPEDTVRYIENMAKELRTLAGQAGQDFLAYLLAMAEDEAANIVRRAGEEAKGGS